MLAQIRSSLTDVSELHLTNSPGTMSEKVRECPYHCTCHTISRLVAENNPSRPTVLLAWPYDLESAVRRGCKSSREIWSIVLKAGQDTAGDEEEGNQPSKDWCDELWIRTDRERACGSLHVPSDPSCHFFRSEKIGGLSNLQFLMNGH